MAIYRSISMNFWTDAKIVDSFTVEDKYFYLYLFTNPHTNLCGCYEISIKQIASETGYSKDTIENLLERFETVHDVIRYSRETKEILILKWGKYNWNNSERVVKGVKSVAKYIKDERFKQYVLAVIDGQNCENFIYPIDRVSIGYAYPMHTSVSVSVSKETDTMFIKDNYVYKNTNDLQNTNDIQNTKRLKDIKDIISYLNNICGTRYKHNTQATVKHISARLAEGYTVDDFKNVIDKKYAEWHGTDMEQYLRPNTLFAGKFESYVNQKARAKPKTARDQFQELLDDIRKGETNDGDRSEEDYSCDDGDVF